MPEEIRNVLEDRARERLRRMETEICLLWARGHITEGGAVRLLAVRDRLTARAILMRCANESAVDVYPTRIAEEVSDLLPGERVEVIRALLQRFDPETGYVRGSEPKPPTASEILRRRYAEEGPDPQE